MTTTAGYMGIDPGASGGMALLYPSGSVVSVTKMLPTERDTWDWLYGYAEAFAGVVALIEKVHSMPREGVASTFKFGVCYGGLRMALIAAGIPFEEVTPQRWQRGLEIPPRHGTESKTAYKNRLKARAQQLFPSAKVTLAVADALLLAEYCRRLRGAGHD
jgi:hypothetical protein